MNEHIKELAKQAGFAMEIDNDPNSPPGWWGAGHNPTFEKFAELIIKECCDAAEETEQLKRENMRLQIYKKAIHEICGYRMASPTGYIMLAKQVVDWYEELSDEEMENKLEDNRLMKRSWINAE